MAPATATANFGPRNLLVNVVVGSRKFSAGVGPSTHSVQGKYNGPTEGERSFEFNAGGEDVIIYIGEGIFNGLDTSGKLLQTSVGEGKWEHA